MVDSDKRVPWIEFQRVAADHTVTDEEVEELFYEWVLNSNEEIKMLIESLVIDRPKLAKKIALKFLSLLN